MIKAVSSDGNVDMFKLVMLIAQAFLLPGGAWVATQIIDIRERTIRLEVQAEAAAITARDRYTSQDAAADRRNQLQVDSIQNRDIGKLEALIVDYGERLRQLENGGP